MKSKIKFIIPISIIAFTLTTLVIVFSSWILTTSMKINSEEVIILYDSEIEEYKNNFINEFEYTKEDKSPHMALDQTIQDDGSSVYLDFINNFDVSYFKVVNGDLTVAKNTIDAGDYIARYYNKESRIYTDYAFSIFPTIPDIQYISSTTEKHFYSPTLGPTDDDFTCTGYYGDGINNTAQLEGSITSSFQLPSEGTLNKDGLNIVYSCTFTPNNKNYYPVKCDVTISLYAVARINNKYYSRIETALNAAISGDEVRIVFNDGVSVEEAVIYDNCEIKSGVVLHLNYDDNSSNNKEAKDSSGNAIHITTLSGESTCNVFVSPNVKILNNGTLEIGGILSGGGGNADFSSHTVTKWAELHMGNNSIIESHGLINCYGYIIQDGEFSNVNILEGEVYLPLVMRDFKGGRTTYDNYNKSAYKVSPFSQFEWRNIQTTLTINYGSSMYCFGNLYANSTNNYTTCNMVGNTNKFFLELNSVYSKVIAKYQPDEECSYITIVGGANTNSLSLSIKVLFFPITVSLDSVYFPLSFRQKITLRPNTEENQTNASFIMNQDFKFLPGSGLTICKGAELSATAISIYDAEDFYNLNINPDNTIVSYPADKEDAYLINNGSLIVGNITGLVQTETEDAFLNITSSDGVSNTMWELITGNGSANGTTWGSMDCYLYLPFKNNTGEPTNTLISSGSDSYVFKSEKYNVINENNLTKTYYSWVQYTNFSKYTLTYDTLVDNLTVDDTYVYAIPQNSDYVLKATDMPNIERTGYKFLGWRLTSNDEYAVGKSITGDTSLYAEWEIETYTISYIAQSSDINDTTDFSSLYSQFEGLTTQYKIDSSKPTLPDTLQFAGYVFEGWWYYKNNTLTPYSDFSVDEATDIILIALFSKEELPYNIYYQLIHPDTNETIGTQVLIAEGIKDLSSFNINDDSYSSIISVIKEAYGNKYTDQPMYFVGYNSSDNTGWYTDRTCATKLEILTKDNAKQKDTYQEIVIYAELVDKITVTYEGHTTEYYYIPGSTITSPTIDNENANYILVWENEDRSIYALPETAITLGQNDVEFTKVKYIKTTISTNNASVSVSTGDNYYIVSNNEFYTNKATTSYIRYGSSVLLTVKYNGDNDQSLTVKTNDKNVTLTNNSYTIDNDTAYTINASSSCITADTLITLADGSKKMVKDLLPTDLLLVFNHITGQFEAAPMIFNDTEPEGNYRIINLKFSDGTIVKVVYEHGFFDLTLNEYVYIRENNAKDFIGHKFYQAEYDGTVYTSKEVELVDVYITEEYTKVYSPVTVQHLNYFTEGMLSMPAGIEGLFNIFEYGENLTYDAEQMQKDIETYGLYTYEDFKDYVPYEVYEMFPAQYFKVAVGKGMLTFEDIVDMIYYYLGKNDLI